MVNVGDDAKISYVRCFHYFIKSEQESINGKPLKKSKFPAYANRPSHGKIPPNMNRAARFATAVTNGSGDSGRVFCSSPPLKHSLRNFLSCRGRNSILMTAGFFHVNSRYNPAFPLHRGSCL
jgi:hypothetical protein